MSTVGTGFDEMLNVFPISGPIEFASDEFESLVLTRMTSSRVIVLGLENMES